MGASKCPHGMPSYWSCEECLYGEAPPPPPPKVKAKPVSRFTAKYDGHCDGCNLGIYVGQLIIRMSDDRYVHDGCE